MGMVIELEAWNKGLERVRKTPNYQGRIELIVCLGLNGHKQEVRYCEVDKEDGLRGDNLELGPTCDTSGYISLLNSRVMALFDDDRKRWKNTDNQFFVDLDLSSENVPAGTRLQMGTSIIEILHPQRLSEHMVYRNFGSEAAARVSTSLGEAFSWGVYARVVRSGRISVGDAIAKL